MSERGEYQKTTILFPIQGPNVILGMKKIGFGEGWFNGYGGKKKLGEKYREGAIRETYEESGLVVRGLTHVANLHFYFDDELGVVSRAYTSTDFTGTPIETDEMKPALFPIDQIPYDRMWPADKFWVPAALDSEVPKPIGLVVHFDKNKGFISAREVNPSKLESKF